MINAICTEIATRSSEFNGQKVKTIYFGGGTPSVLTKSELSQILSTIQENYIVEPRSEITLEANPEDVNADSLSDWKSVGVNRLSIGLQSFKQNDLEWMNRAHSADQAIESVRLAKEAGFENITIDLIYGLPELTLQEWEDHLMTVVKLDVPHISAYCLTIEPNTALNSWVSKGKIKTQDESHQIEQFKLLVDLLRENGFEQYEVSNFAKPGYESKHNSSYWTGEHYIGVGPSAHSFDGDERRWNIANNAQYMNGIESESDHFEIERLTRKNIFNERILTGLRTKFGVRLDDLRLIRSIPQSFDHKLESFVSNGWLINDSGLLTLTEEGKLRADYIASELFVD
jgi:oxygen-independent coproporphyrinogen-3 oxidase